MANANNVTTNDLIQHFKEGEPMTTSRLIAEKFGKSHDNVLKKINNLRIRDPETFGAVRIAESSYSTAQNKVQKEYHLSKDAFAFIAMGFTGIKANPG